jgi:hypothetical protein
MRINNIEDLVGQTIVNISHDDNGLDFIVFNGEEYHLFNLSGDDGPPNDCHVWLESVVGDVKDLVGEKLLKAEVATNSGDTVDKHGNEDSGTWTFYKFATIKGYVDIRFCGTSNGYYCETAVLHDFGKVSSDYVSSIDSKSEGSRYKM